VAAFDDGATAEEIVQQYPSLTLADVYSVLSHCLKHRDAVDAYLAQRATQAQRAMADNPLHFDTRGFRARLMARKQS